MTTAATTTLLWIRGLVFTALVPLVVAGSGPAAAAPRRAFAGGAWNAGWPLVAAGGAIYFACLLRFLASGGTPAIFFTRPLRAIIGEEPRALVDGSLYSATRNPMYLGVVAAIFGQAIVFASPPIAIYGAIVWLSFHFVVVVLEEPHLRQMYGRTYQDYCRRTPRWLL